MQPLGTLLNTFRLRALEASKILTLLTFLVLALESSAPAQQAPRCSAVFDSMLIPATPQEIEALTTSLKRRAFYKYPQTLDENYYERNWQRFDDYAKALLFEAVYSRKYLNTHHYRGASLKAPMIVAFAGLAPSVTKYDQYVYKGQTYNRSDRSDQGNHWPIETFTWRGAIDEPLFPKEIVKGKGMPGRAWSADSNIKVKSYIQESLNRLYSDFAAQGPERKILVPIVQEQDRRDVDRTTHFQIGIHELTDGINIKYTLEEAGHLQVMTSENANEPLHFEEQWGAIERKPGENIGEIGRYYFAKADSKKEQLPLYKYILKKDRKFLLRLMLWQKMLSWANHDVKLDRLFFQVNDRVREVLIGYGIPLEQAKARRVSQMINGEKTEEWIFEMDRPLMLLTEQRIMARVLSNHLTRFFERTVFGGESLELTMKFTRNEIWSLVGMGLVKIDNGPLGEKVKHPSVFDDGFGKFEAVLIASEPKTDSQTLQPLFFITKKRLNDADLFQLHFSANAAKSLQYYLTGKHADFKKFDAEYFNDPTRFNALTRPLEP